LPGWQGEERARDRERPVLASGPARGGRFTQPVKAAVGPREPGMTQWLLLKSVSCLLGSLRLILL